MFEEAFALHTPINVSLEKDGEVTVLHSGEIVCRKLEKGQFWYYIKPNSGGPLWFSHKEVLGEEENIDMDEVLERK